MTTTIERPSAFADKPITLLGALLGWRIPVKWAGTRDQIRSALRAHGFSEKYIGGQLCGSDCFKRSIKEMAERVRAENPGVKVEFTQAKELAAEKTLVYVIGVHGIMHGPHGAQWQANEAYRFVFHHAKAGLDRFESCDPAFQDELWGAASYWEAAVEKKDLVDTIQRIVMEYKTFSVESMNGGKFLPGVHMQDAERLAAFVTAVEPTCALSLWPIADTAAARTNAARDFQAAIQGRLADAKADWDAIIAEDDAAVAAGRGRANIQDRRRNTAWQALKAAEEEIQFYMEAISFNAAEVLAELKALKSAAVDHLP